MGLLLKKPEGEEGAAWPAICVGLFAAFAGILYGYDTGTISGIQNMDTWKAQFFPNETGDPPESEISLIVSILSVGTFVGALMAGILADVAGRKWGIILSAMIPFNLGVALQTGAHTKATFIAGRFFAGLGVGLISVQIPMFQAETLPKWIRGFIIGSYQLAITIGLLLAALVNYGTENRNDSSAYRIPLGIQFAWSLILAGGLAFLPETPRYLIKAGKDSKAIKSLTQLRRLPADHPAIQAEFEEIHGNYEYEKSLGSASYLDCFRGDIGKRTMTGIGIQCLQQLVGVNFIFYYGTTYFSNNYGDALPDAFILQTITNVVNVVGTFPGLYVIDAFGRRPLLLAGALGMGICQYIVAACGVATENDNNSSAIAQFSFICIYIVFFASTFGPGAWVVTGEIFPLKVRAKCLSLTTASNWLFNWLLSFITPYLTGADYANLGTNIFWIWGGFCWIAVGFVWLLVYETKDTTLEQVNELYANEKCAWKSAGYKNQLQERRWSATAQEGLEREKEGSVMKEDAS
ncbi:hypothetical protein MBLNU230_g6838t1 [Neophaeotheca triangularis]